MRGIQELLRDECVSSCSLYTSRITQYSSFSEEKISFLQKLVPWLSILCTSWILGSMFYILCIKIYKPSNIHNTNVRCAGIWIIISVGSSVKKYFLKNEVLWILKYFLDNFLFISFEFKFKDWNPYLGTQDTAQF